MWRGFREIFDLVVGNTAFAMTILFVVAYAFVWTVAFGPSFEVCLAMLGLGGTTAVIEFTRGKQA